MADIHIVHSFKRDGSPFVAKLHGIYTLSGGKIAKLDQLTQTIEGEEADRALAFRTS